MNESTARSVLKRRLLKSGVKNECKICGNKGLWENQKLTLQLDHINGDRFDNSEENLRLLCPNCHSIQKTTCVGKRAKRTLSDEEVLRMVEKSDSIRQVLVGLRVADSSSNYERVKRIMERHGCIKFFPNSFLTKQKSSVDLRSLRKDRPEQNKINWPAPQDLQKLLWQKPTIQIAKELGVSDKAVDKFCKKHNLTKPARGFWATQSNK